MGFWLRRVGVGDIFILGFSGYVFLWFAITPVMAKLLLAAPLNTHAARFAHSPGLCLKCRARVWAARMNVVCDFSTGSM